MEREEEEEAMTLQALLAGHSSIDRGSFGCDSVSSLSFPNPKYTVCRGTSEAETADVKATCKKDDDDDDDDGDIDNDDDNNNNSCIDGRISLNLSKSIQSAAGMKALKPAAIWALLKLLCKSLAYCTFTVQK